MQQWSILNSKRQQGYDTNSFNVTYHLSVEPNLHCVTYNNSHKIQKLESWHRLQSWHRFLSHRYCMSHQWYYIISNNKIHKLSTSLLSLSKTWKKFYYKKSMWYSYCLFDVDLDELNNFSIWFCWLSMINFFDHFENWNRINNTFSNLLISFIALPKYKIF